MNEQTKSKFDERLQRVNDAIALKEPDRVPVCPKLSILPYVLDGCTGKDAWYNFPRATQAIVNFYKRYPMVDAAQSPTMTSGLANELAGTKMIDWPGRPGTKVPDISTHQVIEYEFMSEDEYDEVLKDYTGFMLRKYLPRAYPALKTFEGVKINPSSLLNISPFSGLFSPEMLDTYELLGKIAAAEKEAAAANAACSAQVTELGFPPFYTMAGQAPFDVIGDYFRSTLPTLTDQLEYEDEMLEFCDRIVEMEISAFERLRNADMPVKRVFFPMHKGMDGFMGPEQYEKLYWRPFRRLIDYLVEIGATPYLYTEGKYNSRLEQLRDLPKGKCMIHFETVDMKRAKELLGDTACIVGNLNPFLLENGTPEQIDEEVKKLLDTCAPGGGYIFDCNGGMDLAKPENMDALFEALDKYGKY